MVANITYNKVTNYVVLIFSCELDQLFNQMKNELLHTNPNDIEKVFKLVNEMKNAADRFFALKKLFWKVRKCNKYKVSDDHDLRFKGNK